MRAVFLGRVEYDFATLLQEQFFHGKLLTGENSPGAPDDIILFLEHNPVYTYGKGVKNPLEFFRDWPWAKLQMRERKARMEASSRGGLMTFHGPGQLVGYPILNIGDTPPKNYMKMLETAICNLLQEFGVSGTPKESGIWVLNNMGRERKICSFGVHIGRSPNSGERVTMHGFALNVNTDMRFFDAIYPCGIREEGPVMFNLSEANLNVPEMPELARVAAKHFSRVFGRDIQFCEPEDIGFYPKGKPPWLKISRRFRDESVPMVQRARNHELTTVCEEANCPNIQECWSDGDVTFMILGDKCTRACGFCNIKTAKFPEAPNPLEPFRLASAASSLPHSHIVITSVDRDDLPDGGAAMWAQTIRALRRRSPQKTVEVLIPDFQGKWENLRKVLEANPDVLGHNLETVHRLHQRVRRTSNGYERSLKVLSAASSYSERPIIKSNIMLGHGESDAEVAEMMRDLLEAGTDILTITQYLRPSRKHLPVVKYYSPGEFANLKNMAEEMGFSVVISGPLVRSSYQAGKAYRTAMALTNRLS